MSEGPPVALGDGHSEEKSPFLLQFFGTVGKWLIGAPFGKGTGSEGKHGGGADHSGDSRGGGGHVEEHAPVHHEPEHAAGPVQREPKHEKPANDTPPAAVNDNHKEEAAPPAAAEAPH